MTSQEKRQEWYRLISGSPTKERDPEIRVFTFEVSWGIREQLAAPYIRLEACLGNKWISCSSHGYMDLPQNGLSEAEWEHQASNILKEEGWLAPPFKRKRHFPLYRPCIALPTYEQIGPLMEGPLQRWNDSFLEKYLLKIVEANMDLHS